MSALDGFAVGVFEVVSVLICADLGGSGLASSYVSKAALAANLGRTLSGLLGEVSARWLGYTRTFLAMGLAASAFTVAVGKVRGACSR